MRKIFALALGVLTAIGGFLDIGDIVTNAVVGSRFGLSLVWVVPLGVLGICVFAEMSGRVAAISGRATFEIIRERLGPRMGALNLIGSLLVTALTLTAELGGITLALQLATGVSPLMLLPVAAFAVWIVLWRVKFKVLENVTGILGLSLLVFAVTFVVLAPPAGDVVHHILHPSVPESESILTYWYYAVALFGAAMTPYEVFFFSSGAVEDGWTVKDLGTARLNVLIGFPLGGLLSIALAGSAAFLLMPAEISVSSLSEVVLPVAQAGGQIAVAFALIGIAAATMGASLETALSTGYTISQYAGWSWGKAHKPRDAARFHVALILFILAGALLLTTGVDPIAVTEYSVVFSAVALPLTYLPILIVSNDPQYMGDKVNGRLMNAAGLAFLVIIVVVSLAAIPLLVVTGAGR
ncbi:putative transporter [Gordonia effusa NBRC 100432]|uniref:Putative transporter n=1 Tax=Gordonia effusa NBRC 100432 TaxID=1077974 RepID=H0R5H8_9ACTN|nr:divalent metal cation transporter [Gordonia effusa]GAB20329.1 putative transporter [Gordonia effusa NBRC 100432]